MSQCIALGVVQLQTCLPCETIRRMQNWANRFDSIMKQYEKKKTKTKNEADSMGTVLSPCSGAGGVHLVFHLRTAV